jgi:hypothetical protein
MVMMHLGILALQKILFLDLILMQLAFVDFREIRMAVSKRLAARCGRIQVVYDESISFSRRAVRVLACLDLFGRLDWTPAAGRPSAEPERDLRIIRRGREYRGVAAFRIIALAVPLLWVFVPFLYVPVLRAVSTAAWRYMSRLGALSSGRSGEGPQPPTERTASEVASGVEMSAHRWRFPLVVSGWVLVAMLCWWYRIEYYPLTSWQLFVFPNTSGRITYNRVVARLESGQMAPMRLEDSIGAMRFDGRYAPFLNMCFGRRHRRPRNPQVQDIDVCRKFLMASGSAYNRKTRPGGRVTQLEVQAWEWDFGRYPLDPNYGRVIDRVVVDVSTERHR